MTSWGTDGSSPTPEPEPTPVSEGGDAGDPGGPTPAPARRRERIAEPTPDWLRSHHDPDAPVPPDRDPVAVVAVACGFVGIVVFGLLFAVVTAVLGAWAGQRARDTGRTYELPFLAIGLAFVDGAVWIALHLLIDAPAWIG